MASARAITSPRERFEHLFYDTSVGANPPKHDAWGPYADVVFVLVRNVGHLKPSRGLIIDWKRQGRRWEALVVWRDDAALKPIVKMDWLPIDQMVPVPVDPNWASKPVDRR
jgi:hypothetical protein